MPGGKPACRHKLRGGRGVTVMRERHADEVLGSGLGSGHQAGHWPWAARSADDQAFPQDDVRGLDSSDTLPETGWDPAEELAVLLKEDIQPGQVPSPARLPDSEDYALDRNRAESSTEITADLPPVCPAGHGHHKTRRSAVSWGRAVSLLIALLGGLLACTVSLFSGVITYGPLLRIAVPRAPAGMAAWWPLLVYGPWIVASLSIVRAAFHQRRAAHSWIVVLFFSFTAMLLCAAQADRT